MTATPPPRPTPPTPPTPPVPPTPTGLAVWDDLVPGAERQELADTARRHFAEKFPLSAARECSVTGERPLDRWGEIVEAGYPSIGLPVAHGGIGVMADLVTVLEEAGRALLPLPLAATTAALHTLVRGGLATPNDEAATAALAVQTPLAPAANSGADLVAPDGAGASTVVVIAALDAATTRITAVVPSADADLQIHVDPSRPVARWAAPSSPAATADEATVDAPIDQLLTPARTVLAADLVGVAAGALHRSVEHVLAREQFGKPIGAFQAVKHRLADQYVLLERARSLTRAAAVASDHPELETDWPPGVLALLAKAAAADAAQQAAATFVQLLGAMGMTFEADAHLYFRRAQATSPVLGSAADCQFRATRLMGANR